MCPAYLNNRPQPDPRRAQALLPSHHGQQQDQSGQQQPVDTEGGPGKPGATIGAPGESAKQGSGQEQDQRPGEHEAHSFEASEVVVEREYMKAYQQEKHGQTRRRNERQDSEDLCAWAIHPAIRGGDCRGSTLSSILSFIAKIHKAPYKKDFHGDRVPSCRQTFQLTGRQERRVFFAVRAPLPC
ncbi:MAG: hypothetical protein ACN4GR_03585 [Arenicellales bacterium]